MCPVPGPHTAGGYNHNPSYTQKQLGSLAGDLRATGDNVVIERCTMKVCEELTVPSKLHSPLKNITCLVSLFLYSSVQAHHNYMQFKNRCCYITLDSAMAASQYGICSEKFSKHKTNQYYSETRTVFDSFELYKHRSMMQPLQNPPL